jgi:hypothetical protein
MTNSDPFATDNGGTATDPFADKLSEIKNADGQPKYKSTEDALAALAHSQQFIETLKSEKTGVETQLQQLQTELEKRASVEDVVNRLVKQPSQEPTPTNDKVVEQGLTEDSVRKMMEQVLNQKTQESQSQKNLTTVVNELTKEYGDNLNSVINTRARELNTTPDQLRELAKTNPTMAMGLLSNQKVTSKDPVKPSLTPSRSAQKLPDLPPKPQRSVMQGGMTNEDLADVWRSVREHTHKKLGVES